VKNAKPFRVLKNGNMVDVIKKINPIHGQGTHNTINIQLRRNNNGQNQNNSEQNSVEIDGNSNSNMQ